MKTLVIPVNYLTKVKLKALIKREEEDKDIFWETPFANQLEIGSIVFFPERKKLVRIYKIKRIENNKIKLKKAIGEIYWRDWIYIANNKRQYLNLYHYLIDDEKTKTIRNILSI